MTVDHDDDIRSVLLRCILCYIDTDNVIVGLEHEFLPVIAARRGTVEIMPSGEVLVTPSCDHIKGGVRPGLTLEVLDVRPGSPRFYAAAFGEWGGRGKWRLAGQAGISVYLCFDRLLSRLRGRRDGPFEVQDNTEIQTLSPTVPVSSREGGVRSSR